MKILTYYRNLKIKYKLLLSMLLVTALTSLSITLTNHLFFSRLFIEKANSDIDYSLDVVSASFTKQVTKLQQDISKLSYDQSITQIAKDIEQDNSENFANNYELVQDPFMSILDNNDLVNSIAILGKNGEFYSTTPVGLSYDNTNMYIWSDTFVPEIHWYSSRNNPFTKYSNQVIPIIFPTGMNYGYITFLPQKEYPLMNVVVLLDAVELNTYFAELNKNALSTMAVVDADFNPVSIDASHPLHEMLTEPDFLRQYNELDGQQRFSYHYKGHSYSVTVKNLPFNGLSLINIISQSELLSGINTIRDFTNMLAFISLSLSIAISLIVAFSITSPLNKLMQLVKNTETGSQPAEIDIITDSKDEIGILNSALNDMSHVILDQVETIKKEQQLKTEAEIDILTHQINPHFIYNTLDCIRWEILNNNIEGSSQMVESLGTFLRIGLNGSNRVSTIEQELQHIQEYISIMNNRLGYIVRLITKVPTDLMANSILKIILQPLVENCIQHAFDADILSMMSDVPTITIEVTKDDLNTLKLSVIDNGKGIDTEKAYDCLYTNTSKKSHIGLNNVYLRLRAYYGDHAKIEFSSIPFFRNSVILSIPVAVPDNTPPKKSL